jgi:uncharacterized protein (DUF305 family)
MRHKPFFVGLAVVLLAGTLSAQRQVAFRTLPAEQQPVPAARAAQTDPNNEPFEKMMADAMEVMNTDMNRMAGMGDPDQQFAMAMIPHHQSAIDMAKAELLYGKNEQLRRLAQEIVTDQQNEIQVMKLWLTQHPVTDGGGSPRSMKKGPRGKDR